jgi:hypothetical protein
MYPSARVPDVHVDMPTNAPSLHPVEGNAELLAVLAAHQAEQAGVDAGTTSLWDAFDIGSEFAPLMGTLSGSGDSASVLDPLGA